MNSLRSSAWWDAALTRALKTAAQTVVAMMGTNAVSITELDWLGIGSVAATSAVLSIVTSLAGLPEVGE